ncbi:MAG TPA: hypothetical protein VHY19_13005 [Steroidobacteraceae bacterium]|nr:hypothetical protein [Steroidobacteraceae bacterium]
MSKVFAKIVGILALSAGMASTALAGQWSIAARHGIQFNGANQPNVVSAPEIDPAGALSGLTLLLGGLAVVRGSRSKK